MIERYGNFKSYIDEIYNCPEYGFEWDLRLPNDGAGMSFYPKGGVGMRYDYTMITSLQYKPQLPGNGVPVWWHNLYVYGASCQGY